MNSAKRVARLACACLLALGIASARHEVDADGFHLSWPTATLTVGTVSGLNGQQLTVPVTLLTNVATAAIENEIYFDPNTPILARPDGRPACVVTVASKNRDADVVPSPSFTFLPNGCQGSACHGIRALIVSFHNLDPIPNGRVYTCKVYITPNAPAAAYPLQIYNVQGGVSSADPVLGSGVAGYVIVQPLPTPPPGARCG